MRDTPIGKDLVRTLLFGRSPFCQFNDTTNDTPALGRGSQDEARMMTRRRLSGVHSYDNARCPESTSLNLAPYCISDSLRRRVIVSSRSLQAAFKAVPANTPSPDETHAGPTRLR